MQLALTQEVPVPTMLIWSPQKTPVKTIVPPTPDKPTAADVTPSPVAPNEEVDLSDVSISAPAVTAPKLPTPATTTSPVTVQAPQRVQLAPTTVSQPSAQPTPAAILSLSDLKMAQGTVVLPPVNESAASNAPGVLAPGSTDKPSAPGNGKDAGDGATGQGAAAGAAAPANPTAVAKADVTDAPAAPGSDAGNAPSDQPTATRITLPKNGQFGAVVVGD